MKKKIFYIFVTTIAVLIIWILLTDRVRKNLGDDFYLSKDMAIEKSGKRLCPPQPLKINDYGYDMIFVIAMDENQTYWIVDKYHNRVYSAADSAEFNELCYELDVQVKLGEEVRDTHLSDVSTKSLIAPRPYGQVNDLYNPEYGRSPGL